MKSELKIVYAVTFFIFHLLIMDDSIAYNFTICTVLNKLWTDSVLLEGELVQMIQGLFTWLANTYQ